MGVSCRNTSESSDDFEIIALEFGDLKRRISSDDEEEKKSQNQLLPSQRFFSAVMGMKRKKSSVCAPTRSQLVRMAWKNAAMKALSMGDPWEKFNLGEYRTESAKRHRYHALKQRWIEDTVLVKMERKSFNHGAMRECFRMKKKSNFSKSESWDRAHNYVAKRYMNESVPRETYFEDVRLQMDAKLWGEEFNRHNPPKKVDIFQMAILEMTERPGRPLYHVEHFIEGKYVKYNSNSGFVLSEALRMTPQAFSHFTFERSGHELIVVDIQGVGDLYTDPQIHTASGIDYGDGNLGVRGMALFFHSHICNSICRSLDLTQFDLAHSEKGSLQKISSAQKSCKTVVRGTVEPIALPRAFEKGHMQECIRLRSLSSGYLSSDERDIVDASEGGSMESVNSFDDLSPRLPSESEDSAVDTAPKPRRRRRQRYDSICDFGESTETQQNDIKNFNNMVKRKTRPSHVYGELEHQKMLQTLLAEQANGYVDNLDESYSETNGTSRTNKTNGTNGTDHSSDFYHEKSPHVKIDESANVCDDSTPENSILGEVHVALTKYHELNRFVIETETYDHPAALFHLLTAARCGNLEAVLAVAQIHLGLSQNVLPDVELPEEERDLDLAFEFLTTAARAGDRSAMVRVATALESGVGLPDGSERDWAQAAKWLDSAAEIEATDVNALFDEPSYQLHARLAEMYLAGGYNLEKDPNRAGEMFTSAADLATVAMKGKLASRFYMRAEEAWAEMEEEEE